MLDLKNVTNKIQNLTNADLFEKMGDIMKTGDNMKLFMDKAINGVNQQKKGKSPLNGLEELSENIKDNEMDVIKFRGIENDFIYQNKILRKREKNNFTNSRNRSLEKQEKNKAITKQIETLQRHLFIRRIFLYSIIIVSIILFIVTIFFLIYF